MSIPNVPGNYHEVPRIQTSSDFMALTQTRLQKATMSGLAIRPIIASLVI